MKKKREGRDDAGEVGDLIAMLRWLGGLESQAELSRRSGISRTQLNRYERGRQKAGPAILAKIAEAAGVDPRQLDFLDGCRRLLRTGLRTEPPAARHRPADEIASAVARVAEQALALLSAERGAQAPPAAGGALPTAGDHERVEALFETLMSVDERQRRLIVTLAPEYQDPLFCLRLCRASEEEAPNDPSAALGIAELALAAARHLPESDLKPRVEAWCLAHVANCARVLGNGLPRAGRLFPEVWKLWKEGVDTASFLSTAYLLDMEASLRRDQRRFSQAHELHDKALKLARPGEQAVILLSKAGTHQQEGKHEEALRVLTRAQGVVTSRQPRAQFGIRFNQASNLIALGRAAEAEPVVAEVRGMVERLGKATDRVRTLWLEGSCAAALGRRGEALTALQQVREAFRSQAFDFALVSLDVALLYREEGRFPEIAALAGEILEIFRAQEVHREALAAVVLLQEAADKAEVSTALLRSLKLYLCQARVNPAIRFGV